jgi:hypothetical protein
MDSEEEQANYDTFRDCLSDALIQNLTVTEPKQRKRAKSGRQARRSVDGKVGAATDDITTVSSNDAEELGEFIEVYFA